MKLDCTAVSWLGFQWCCFSDVQQRIKAVALIAVYIRGYAHCLNLHVVVQNTKSVSEAELFILSNVMCIFMSTSNSSVLKAYTVHRLYCL